MEASIDTLTSPHALTVEHDTRDGRVARRTVLLGLWAAQRLALEGPDAETYAWSVHFADLGAPGYDDVVAKVAADLAAAGQPVPDRIIRSVLREMEARAELQLAAEPICRPTAQPTRDRSCRISSQASSPSFS